MEEGISKVKPAIAFVGTGWIGLNRMKSLLDEDLCNPVAIVEPDERNAAKASEMAPGARVFESIEELIQSNPEGVVIATPSALHAVQCIEVLEKGIPVFCQKPLARTATETARVISAAFEADRLLGLDLSYRYTEGMQKIHGLYRKELGVIFAVDLVFNNAYGPDKAWFYDPRLSGGGCLIDLGVHLIDLALWVLDFPVISRVNSTLVSKGKVIREDNPDIVEDYVSAQLETADGVIIRLVCSWNLSAGRDAEIRASFYGTEASALFYNVDGSFYNFGAAVCHGTSREIISRPPDQWGGRAVTGWIRKLQDSPGFRKSAFRFYETAEVIDRIYRRDIKSKPFRNENTDNS